jgi:hypothetical protein
VQFNISPRTKAQVPPSLLGASAATIVALSTADQIKAARHHEIAARHKRRKRPPANCVRVSRELRKFFGDRYDKHGPAMPEGCDAALDDFAILLNYTAMLGDFRALQAAKARWMPWLDEAAFDAMVAKVVSSPLYLSPDALGERIGLYDAKRTELKIRSIGGIGCTKAQRADRRKATNTTDHKVKRAADRARRPAKINASKTKPWLALGMKRSSYYAMLKRQASELGQNLSAVSLLYVADNICPSTPTGALPTGKSAAADVVLNAAAASNAAVVESQSVVAVMDQTKRDSAVAGRLGMNWIRKGQKPFDNLSLATPSSQDMGRAAA